MKGILIELKDGGETVRHFKIDWIWYLPKGFVQLTCLSAAVFSLDQIWKKKINREKEENFPKKLRGTKGMIEIRKAHNPGFSMGKLEKYPKLVGFVSIFATGFLFFSLPYFSYTVGDNFLLQKIGTALILGGAGSNTLDRIRDGKVTDYIYIRIGVLKKAIVNLADMAIFFGSLLYLLVFLWKAWKKTT